jgi:serine/threonine protein phosphatase 1
LLQWLGAALPSIRASVVAKLVINLATVRRCLRIPKNTRGRDLVVGDLHGHRALLEAELERMDFDPARDRLFSVGDLIDRGPDSLGTASLIGEPWFFAVLGNHELMLLNYLGFYSSRMHSRKAFAAGSGEWVKEALEHEPRSLHRTARHIAQLPLALHVEDDVPFNVTHADLHSLGPRPEQLFAGADIPVREADWITSSRDNIGEALSRETLDLPFAEHTVRLSDTPVGPWPVTYVGHSPVRDITVHKSHVYIDQGVCAASRRGEQRPPTVLEHRKFAYWLRGVSRARGQAAPERPICTA